MGALGGGRPIRRVLRKRLANVLVGNGNGRPRLHALTGPRPVPWAPQKGGRAPMVIIL